MNALKIFFSQSLQVVLMYRISMLQFLLGEIVHISGIIFFWLAATAHKDLTAGYSRTNLIAYFILTAFHHLIQETGLTRDLSADIRMGKLAVQLVRPIHPLLHCYGRFAGQVSARSIVFIPVVMVSLWFIGFLDFTAWSPLRFFQYLSAFALLLVTTALIRSAIGLLAFWFTQTWGPEIMMLALYMALSGSSFPPDVLPAWAFRWIQWTPFYYMQGFPSLVALGHIPDNLFLQQYITGCGVAGILFLLQQLLWKRGIRSFEAIGI